MGGRAARLLLPALLKLSASWPIPVCKLTIPVLSSGTFFPKRTALLSDLVWPGDGRKGRKSKGKEGGQRSRLRSHLKWYLFRGWEGSRPGMCVMSVCVYVCMYVHVRSRTGVKVGGEAGKN